MKARIFAEKIEGLIESIRHDKPHLFDCHDNPIGMAWELLREVRDKSEEFEVHPFAVMKILGFESHEYERIIF